MRITGTRYATPITAIALEVVVSCRADAGALDDEAPCPARDYRSSQVLRLPIYEEIRKSLQVPVRVQPAAPYDEVKGGDAAVLEPADARDAVLAAAEWLLVTA